MSLHQSLESPTQTTAHYLPAYLHTCIQQRPVYTASERKPPPPRHMIHAFVGQRQRMRILLSSTYDCADHQSSRLDPKAIAGFVPVDSEQELPVNCPARVLGFSSSAPSTMECQSPNALARLSSCTHSRQNVLSTGFPRWLETPDLAPSSMDRDLYVT